MQQPDTPAQPRELPLLMTDLTVRSTLAGTKTNTRRLIAKQATHDLYYQRMYGVSPPPNPVAFGTPGLWRIVGPDYPDDETDNVPCPFGQPGDLLWVREAYSGPARLNGTPPKDWPIGTPIWYWADGNPPHGDWTRPKRSIHMTRWASRILLKNTDVRTQRLQSISEGHAQAEGLIPLGEGSDRTWSVDGTAATEYETAVGAFRHLWEMLHGTGSWDRNPWVWAVTFEHASRPGGQQR